MNAYITQEIKSRIPMRDLLEHYGFDIKRNRIKCPLHNGDDRNCGVKDGYIHCFVCGESADQIALVQRYFDLSFSEAIEKLNCDFHLGLPIGEKLDRRKREDIARKSFHAKQRRRNAEKVVQETEQAYFDALAEYERLTSQKAKYAPTDESTALHPLFVEALQKIAQAEHALDCAETEFFKCKKS